MNLGEMRTAFASNVDEAIDTSESSTVFYTEEEVNLWLNVGVKETARRLPPELLRDLQTKITGTASTGTLPTDFLLPVAAKLDGAIVPVLTSPNTKMFDTSLTNASFNRYCLIWGGIATFHTAGDYEIYYIKEPVEMSLDTDTPEIPEQYHYSAVLYATYLGLLKNEVVENNYFTLFMNSLNNGGEK